MNSALLGLGAFLVIFWGTAHLFPTQSVVRDFGDISEGNKRILIMEWINEGLTLIFIGVMVLLTAFWGQEAITLSRVVNGAASLMLFSMTILSLFTGFRVDYIPFKLCPLVFMTSAVLILLGSYL